MTEGVGCCKTDSMPKRTNMLKSYFVTRPNCPVDQPLQTCCDAWAAGNEIQLSDSRFPAEFITRCANRSEEWCSKYLTCEEFFREFAPLHGPFTIFQMSPGNLYGAFRVLWTDAAIPILESGLNQEKPVCWHQRPEAGYWVNYGLYLFGPQLWEVTEFDKKVGEQELRLLFLEALDRDRQKFERLRRKFMGAAGARIESREAISEEVRIFVWRRDGGRCVQCGNQERLEFDHVIPVSRGGSNTARNIQLLCDICNRKKGDVV